MSTILVVDDDENMRDLLSQVLKSAGHTSLAAQNGKEGLSFARNHPVDATIIDILMPEMDGFEMIGRLKETHSHLPILAISGGDSPGLNLLPRAKALGAHFTLQKPFDPREIIELVDVMLSQ